MIRPVRLSAAIVSRRSWSTPVRCTLSPATTGDEFPVGTGVFHSAFSSGPNETGRLVASETPAALGPPELGPVSGQEERRREQQNDR
jgi:hypothetical protein